MFSGNYNSKILYLVVIALRNARASSRLFNTCCDPGVQSLVVHAGRIVFVLIQTCNGLRGLCLVKELASMAEVFKEFAKQQKEGCSGVVFSED